MMKTGHRNQLSQRNVSEQTTNQLNMRILNLSV
jgi:hypothetical protein